MNDIPGVPPPPPEVKVRTMKSDVESMQKSGGGLPQFQNVTVAGLAMERAVPTAVAAPEAAAEMARAEASAGLAPAGGESVPDASATPSGSRNMMGIILVVIVALAAVAAVWYFAYKELGAPSVPSGASAPAAAGQ